MKGGKSNRIYKKKLKVKLIKKVLNKKIKKIRRGQIMRVNELENLIKQLEENGQTKEADNLKILLSLLN